MYNVYMKSIKIEKESFVNTYTDIEDAIRKIASLYKIDKDTCCLGEYYYFIK